MSQFGDVSLVIRRGRLISEGGSMGRLVLVLRDTVLARNGNGWVWSVILERWLLGRIVQV